MFIQITQLQHFDNEEYEKVTYRWETKEGKKYYNYIIEQIRKGGGEHLLEWEFQNGKFGNFLDSE